MKTLNKKAKEIIWVAVALLSLLVLISCNQQLLEPNENGSPSIYFKADFDGIQKSYQSGIASIYSNSYNLLLDHDSLIVYHFILDDLKNIYVRYIDVSINNYTFPYKNFEDDIDSAIKPGQYKYRNLGPNPGNPKRLSEIIITWYNNKSETHSSLYIDQKHSTFNIIEVSDTILHLQKGSIKAKKAIISFNCTLRNTMNGDTINLQNGNMSALFIKKRY